MMIRRNGALVALLAALFLAGCAGDTVGTDDAAGGAGPSSPGATAISVAPQPTDPTTEPTAKVPGGKTPGSGGTETITGTIAAGVEPGCLVLTSPSGGSHLLIVRDAQTRAAAKVGSSVTVVGRAQPDMMSTCQQGTPFVVSELRAD
jgi:hypothetical protein